MVRAERTGPTGSASMDWNTDANRVTLPSTISSKTTSAELMPTCGRPPWPCAGSALSIFTTSAGRAAFAGSSTGSPVSGKTGPGAAVVVVASVVVVVTAVVVVSLVATSPSPPPAARAATPMRMTTTARIPPMIVHCRLVQSGIAATVPTAPPASGAPTRAGMVGWHHVPVPSVSKVLIANRGEIAVRIARAVHDEGMAAITVHTVDDAASPHVGVGDASVALPGTGPAGYLDIGVRSTPPATRAATPSTPATAS